MIINRRALLGALLSAAATFGLVGVSSTPASACPTWQGSPHFGTIQLTKGFLPDPWNRSVTAGGSYSLSQCGFGVSGWVARRPDYRVQYSSDGGVALTFIIQSNADTVLLINDPSGNWHFDDDSGGDFGTQGLGAALRLPNAPGGQYDIWIGTYERASGIPATLQISERY